jgi:hypothetical protein
VITPHTNVLPPELRRPANPTTCADAEKAAQLARIFREFCAVIDAIYEEFDDGFVVEDFAQAYSLFDQLRTRGVKFCPAFCTWMDELHAELRHTDADSDGDTDVVDSEKDDPDEDHYDELHIAELQEGADADYSEAERNVVSFIPDDFPDDQPDDPVEEETEPPVVHIIRGERAA